MKTLSDENRLDLLKSYLSILPPRWAAMQSYIAMYFTLVSAILGFSLTQVGGLVSQERQALLALPLLSVSLIAWFAMRSVVKQDRHIKEVIVVIAKLEHSIGLYAPDSSELPFKPWQSDEHYLPPRWIKARLASGPLSDSFIDAPIGGTAKLACQIFGFFLVVGLVLTAAVVAAQLNVLAL